MKRSLGIILITLVILAMFVGTASAAGIALPPSETTGGIVLGVFLAAFGMALAADTARDYEIGDINELPVAASSTLYEGSAVGDNGSGYARALTAGDPFRGFAISQVDNSSGSAGAKRVRVNSRGKVKLSIGSLALTDVGADVYASDDGTFTLTAGSNSRIGVVHRYVSSGVGIVAFDVAETQTVGTSELAADCITGAKIADDAVDTEHIADDAVDTAQIAGDAVTGDQIADDAVSAEHLDDGILPSHIVVYAGEHTTVGGGAAEAITVTGALASDLVLAQLHTAGSSPQTILTAVASADTVTVTFSADPSDDHVVTYAVLRAVS